MHIQSIFSLFGWAWLFCSYLYSCKWKQRAGKKQTLLNSGKGGPWETTFFNATGQRSPKLYLIKTVGPGESILGMKSFSPQQNYMKFSPHTDFFTCGQWSLVRNSYAMKGTFGWLAFHYEYLFHTWVALSGGTFLSFSFLHWLPLLVCLDNYNAYCMHSVFTISTVLRQ